VGRAIIPIAKLRDDVQMARAHLRAMLARLQADSPVYARLFALRLRQRLAALEEFPDMGRRVPEDSA
jgi:plasmid stabilization system protein ParE